LTNNRARKKTRIAELEEENAGLKEKLKAAEMEILRLKEHASSHVKAISSATSILQQADLPPLSTAVADLAPAITTSILPPHRQGSSSISPLSVRQPVAGTPRQGSLESLEVASTYPSPDTTDRIHLDLLKNVVNNGHDSDTVVDSSSITLSLDSFSEPDLGESFEIWGYGLEHLSDTNTGLSILFPDPMTITGDPMETDISLVVPYNNFQPNDPPVWEQLPMHIPETCQLDHVMLDLIQSTRFHLSAQHELTASTFPSISSLLNPTLDGDLPVINPVTNAVGKHMKITMIAPSLSVRVAFMFNLCMVVRVSQSDFKVLLDG